MASLRFLVTRTTSAAAAPLRVPLFAALSLSSQDVWVPNTMTENMVRRPALCRSFGDDARARREAREAREAELASKRSRLAAIIGSTSSSSTQTPTFEDMDEKRRLAEKERSAAERRSKERAALVAEASSMTRSLYRLCLRSAEALRPGNDRDEAEFREREERQLRELEEDFDASAGVSFSPPVDRENELRSRAEYYGEQTREEFIGEMDCLLAEPWGGEADVGRYIKLLRLGEERRRWVLDDYGFNDPYQDRFDHNRLENFEERAWALVGSTSKAKAYPVSPNLDEEEEDFFDDDYLK